MKIGLHDSDNMKFPNLALMKLSAWHKAKGDDVSFFNPLVIYDKIYSSKVFTFTPDDIYLPRSAEKGGTGYSLKNELVPEIEHICPDYSLYDIDYSMGFLTRGCPRKCKFCVVPEKEGTIKNHAEIEEFTKHKEVILLDNNILASPHGIQQLEKIIDLGLKIDINQGMDARLVDKQTAKLLAKIKWIRFLRFSCDHEKMIPYIKKTVKLLSDFGVKPYRILCYFLITNISESIERAEQLSSLGIDIFAMPFRDFSKKTEPDQIIKKFARWVNHKAIFKTVKWEDYLRVNKPINTAQMSF